MAPRPSRWFWVAAVAGVTVWAVMFTQYRVFEDVSAGRADTFWQRFADELAGAYAALAFLPALTLVMRRFPVRRAGLARALAAHAAALAAYSLAHTCVLAIVHRHGYPLVGLPPDEFAVTAPRILQELGHDVVGYLAFAAFYEAWEAARIRRARELAHAELASVALAAQLQALRLQLEPHFLFNTLNTIADAIHDSPRAAEAMVQHLAALLRATLRAPSDHEGSLADELALLDHYIAIMTARFGDKLAIRVVVAPGAERMCVPPLLLQPLVENVVRHGMIGGRLEIELRATLAGDSLVLEVLDNGPGSGGTGALGVGLTTTTERLRLLHGDAAELVARDRPEGGFGVRIRLPAREAA
jgi:two-component system, LytTR family, sensor kinase